MKNTTILSIAVLSAITAMSLNAETLTGDRRTACEVILCLSSSTRPSECNPSLQRFFSIKYKKPSKTLQARKNFLKLCPTDDGTTSNDKIMQDLKNIIVQSDDPNQCKPNYLNNQLQYGNISYRTDPRNQTIINAYNNGIRITSTMPSFCYSLINHQYTDYKMPKYICNGEFYDKIDWQNGYKTEIINKTQFNSLPNDLKYKYNYDCGDFDYYRTCTQYIKKTPISKICWTY